jgi:L-threonylcarbamoyladenylate synthase
MARILSIDFPEAIVMAVQALKAGGLIVLPTDTVYGVGSLIEEAAIERIYKAKKRMLDKALPVLLANTDAVELVAREFPEPARRLAEVFWPGPLTMALPRRDDLPPNLSHLPTVGVRVPDHDATRALLAAAGGAMAVTSANRSDQLPACTIRYLSDAVALYLDDGACPGGVPSTVITFEEGEVRVVRAGPISENALRNALD